MRVVFMGTPDFSVPTLSEIVAQGHDVIAVYTQPPRKAGRGMALTRSPVEAAAERFGLPVFTPENFKDPEDVAHFIAHDADVAVVVAYGLILPKVILEAPVYGALNLHASLLPRWRGAAPINRAIMAGDRESGVMVMQMAEGLDTGPVLMAERITITPQMTAGDLHDRLMILGGDLMARALGGLERGSLATRDQGEEGVTYAHKLQKSMTRIDFSKPAEAVHDHIRGLSPFPGAWCALPLNGTLHRLKVIRSEVAANPALSGAEASAVPGQILDDRLTIACGTGAVRLLEVQRSGKVAMSAAEFLRGHALQAGMMIADDDAAL